MPDSTPSTGDRTVVVHRHGALTYISLGFNALILLLILIGFVARHHRPPEDPGARGGGPAECHDFSGHDHWGHHGFGGMGHEWGHHEFADRGEDHFSGPEEGGPPHGFGMDAHPGWGAPGGFGPGMEHPQAMTPPSAEEMTDRCMLALDEKLTLTDAENGQIRPIVQEGIAQLQKDMQAQKDAHQKMIDDAKTKIRAVLTVDQQKAFDAMTAGMGVPPAPGK